MLSIDLLYEFQERALQVPAYALLIVAVCAASAHAQSWQPNKPIRVIVPFPPGGGADIFARMIGQKLTATLNQPLVVDNRAGASGNIGVELAAKAPADGYTLLVTTATLAINPGLFPTLPFDVKRDLAPITLFAAVPHIMCAHPSLPVRSVKN